MRIDFLGDTQTGLRLFLHRIVSLVLPDLLQRKVRSALSLVTASLFFSFTPTLLHGAGTAPSPFLVFDGTLYRNKPELSHYGVRPSNIIYAGQLWDQNESKNKAPHKDTVRRLAAEAAKLNANVVIDIEHWPLKGTDQEVAKSVAKYAQVVEWFRFYEPRLSLGYYGEPPIRDYHRAIKDPNTVGYGEWQRENDRLVSLSMHVDAIYPSLYTFYSDRDEWKKYAIAQLREAKRYGKPVYAFLWPQYHESNRLLGGRYIAPDYWQVQLETVRQYADGIVLWGGWGSDGPAEWDEKAPWWVATKNFMRQLNQTSVSTISSRQP
jgi:hypothetical protein